MKRNIYWLLPFLLFSGGIFARHLTFVSSVFFAFQADTAAPQPAYSFGSPQVVREVESGKNRRVQTTKTVKVMENGDTIEITKQEIYTSFDDVSKQWSDVGGSTITIGGNTSTKPNNEPLNQVKPACKDVRVEVENVNGVDKMRIWVAGKELPENSPEYARIKAEKVGQTPILPAWATATDAVDNSIRKDTKARCELPTTRTQELRVEVESENGREQVHIWVDGKKLDPASDEYKRIRTEKAAKIQRLLSSDESFPTTPKVVQKYGVVPNNK